MYYEAGQENLQAEAERNATALHTPAKRKRGGSPSTKADMGKLAKLGQGKKG